MNNYPPKPIRDLILADMRQFAFLLLAQLAGLVIALTPAEWRNQSIYFVVTDRFARTDDSTTAPCNTTAGEYCDGTFQGIIDHLGYIQDMGFTAVSRQHFSKTEGLLIFIGLDHTSHAPDSDE